MANPLVLKLDHAGVLDDADRAVLREVSSHTRTVEARQDLIREGDRPENVQLVMEGIAFRYKILASGRRQIMAVLLPGDFCDLHVAILGEMDHCIGTLSRCLIAVIPRETVTDLTAHHPRIGHALLWATLVDEGVLREWLTNMGQREGVKQVAHLFCELLVRLQAVDQAAEASYDLRMTQIELADLLGMTAVHINRMLRELRESGLATMRGRLVEIPDVARLKAYSGFNPNYLHLTPRATNHHAVAAPGRTTPP